MYFSDTIFDLSRETTFLIEEFPFQPTNLLYRVYDGGWDSGFRINELLIDDKYNARYNFQSDLSDDMRGFTLYENGRYEFEYKIVLETSGKYCTIISDQYEHNLGSGLSELNETANSIKFDGRCPDADFYIASIIEGESNIDEYLNELVYLDKEVYFDKLGRLNNLNRELFGRNALPLEWNGVFCFEVVE